MKRGYTLSEADAALRRRRRQVGRALGLDEPERLARGDADRRAPRPAARPQPSDDRSALTAREPQLH
jgi:hypothetical protein